MQLDLIFLSCATFTGPPALNRLMINHTTLADDLLDAGRSASTIRSLILKVGGRQALSKPGSVRKQLLDMPLPRQSQDANRPATMQTWEQARLHGGLDVEHRV